MALRVLDGNQTATTLSSVVTGGEHIVAHSVVSLGANAITDVRNAVSGSVVSISNFPSTQTIAGTVTANVPVLADTVFGVTGADVNAIRTVIYSSANSDFGNDQGAPVDSSNPLPISGTVTANVVGTRTFVDANAVTVSGFLAVGGWDVVNSRHAPIPLNDGATGVKISFDDIGGTPVKVGSLPSGALTTRFGSVTTANLSQITTAVTNTSRKYLLAQNISAGTVTIGIGFSPTTTRGIQLTAGAGLTFDAFCPTGAVYWLGAVTGAAWTILEG